MDLMQNTKKPDKKINSIKNFDNISEKNNYININEYFYTADKNNALKILKSNEKSGLSSVEAKQRQEIFGFNQLNEAKRKSLLFRFLEQFSDFMVIILLIAAGISFFTAIIEGNKTDFLDPVIILIIIIINSIVGVIQEFKAEKSIEALKNMTVSETVVLRDGKKSKISAEYLVPGDIIILEAGNSVPADARILENISVEADESALTGESIPVIKEDNMIFSRSTALGDRKNMLYMTSAVTSGKCTAVVTNTGMSTEVGKIAEILTQEDDAVTPLQEKLSHTGKILGITALVVCAFIFILGIIQKIPVLEMFMLSISLAVAAMPEGLPAIVTIVLAIGVQRMAKNNAIIRKLSAVETLGSATVICSDKTGTLTQNKMTVTEIYMPGQNDEKKLLMLAVLCNNSSKNQKLYIGDPTENAICYAADKINIRKSEEDLKYPRLSEIPFDSSRKIMTTVNKLSNEKSRVITKGAPDVLLNNCVYYLKNGLPEILTAAKRSEIINANENMAKNALRVIAVAYKDVNNAEIIMQNTEIKNKNLEINLIFCGLIGMIDPPRPEVFKAIQTCKTAGIKPVMITGDHKITAMAIAEKIGIYNKGDKIATGAELDEMSDEYLLENIYVYSVFARVSPEHKMRIVKAFKNRGNVVAMTGDGVNDAPSLKIADMGCAMGQNGTDVARNSADMILVDDNFSTIVEAVRQGRGIYENIKKSIHFLLSSNFGEIMAIFASFLLRLPSPLIAIHLLWVNFVTDSLPALALSAENPGDAIMRRPPLNSKKSLFADGLGLKIIFEGLMIGSLTLLAFIIGYKYFDNGSPNPVYARTMAFTVLSISELVHAYNMRSAKSVFKVGFFSNKRMNFAFVTCLLLQISVVVIKPLSEIFKTVNLPLSGWITVGILSIAPLVIIELQKLILKE
ncbi:MAG: calcium-translocating P-type ATPase, PMCA-type [Oscillospiraceae bacterium]|nr:calcium-translocating P-type ATPase, PMCA-type [Oscillospiraceae bacterium]